MFRVGRFTASCTVSFKPVLASLDMVPDRACLLRCSSNVDRCSLALLPRSNDTVQHSTLRSESLAMFALY